MSAPAATGFFSVEQRKKLEFWRGFYPHPQMGLLEALREVQEWHRCVPQQADAELAELFRIPDKVVREVATFYPFYTEKPHGKKRIGVCHNLSCSLDGAKRVLRGLEGLLGVREGGSTPDGGHMLEAVECLGACELAPAVALGDELIGRADPDALQPLLSLIDSGSLPEPPLPFVYKPKGEDKRILTKHFENPSLHLLATYRELGGYKAWEKAKGMAPAEIAAEVQKSNLRGLGGAGFPSGFKWSTVPAKDKRGGKPAYVIGNFDESEPGCFKDRALFERSPHLLVEGAQIAARAIEAEHVIIFVRGEYAKQYRMLQKAIDEARSAGLLAVDIKLMRGANAYISGADTALLESVEGKKAWPRQPPPFPTVAGVLGCPTLVHNVETLAMLPSIVANGGAWFAAQGAGKCGGTAVFSISGHVERPGLYEFPMGSKLRDILEAAGGVRGGKKLKAVIPGGTSTPMLTASEIDVAMDFDSLRSVGSFLGAGGIVVLDETADIVEALFIIERFLWHESCGQCTPCREGSGWVSRILKRILAEGGIPEDLDNLTRIGENITGKVICALGDTVGMVAKSTIAKFRPEFEAKLGKAGAAR